MRCRISVAVLGRSCHRMSVCYDVGVWQREAVRHSGKFFKHMIPAVIKPLHSLWNEVIGFLFLSFGVMFGFRTYHQFNVYSAATTEAGTEFTKLVMLSGVTLVMICFGVSAFLKARRISRS